MLKSIAVTLVLSVTLLAGTHDRASAMLAPAPAPEAPAAMAPADQAPSAQRMSDMKTVQKTLESKVLRQRLHELGLTDSQIDARLSRLSDQQLHQMASQIRTLNPGGDGLIVGLLVIVLLVVLIIYLVKRI